MPYKIIVYILYKNSVTTTRVKEVLRPYNRKLTWRRKPARSRQEHLLSFGREDSFETRDLRYVLVGAANMELHMYRYAAIQHARPTSFEWKQQSLRFPFTDASAEKI